MTDPCGIPGITSKPQKKSTFEQLLRKIQLIFQTTKNNDGLNHVDNIQEKNFNFNNDIDSLITTIAETGNKKDKQMLISSLFAEENSPFNLLKLDDSQCKILNETLKKFENDEQLKDLKNTLGHIIKLNTHV